MSTTFDDPTSYDEDNQSMIVLHEHIADEQDVDNIHTNSNLFNNVPIARFSQQVWHSGIDDPNTILCHTGSHFETPIEVSDTYLYPTIIPEARDLYHTEPPGLVVASLQGSYINNLHLTTPQSGMMHGCHVSDKHNVDFLNIDSYEIASSGKVKSPNPINTDISSHHLIPAEAWVPPNATGNNEAIGNYAPSSLSSASNNLTSVAFTQSALSSPPSPCQGQCTRCTPCRKSYPHHAPSGASTPPYGTSGPNISPFSITPSNSQSHSTIATTPSTSHTTFTPQTSPNTNVHLPLNVPLCNPPLYTPHNSNQAQVHRWASETCVKIIPPAECFEKSKWQS